MEEPVEHEEQEEQEEKHDEGLLERVKHVFEGHTGPTAKETDEDEEAAPDEFDEAW